MIIILVDKRGLDTGGLSVIIRASIIYKEENKMPLPLLTNPLLPEVIKKIQEEKPAKGAFPNRRKKKDRDARKNKPQEQKDTMLLKTGGKVSKGGAPNNRLY